jgi:general secretion pathway protein D
MIYRFCSVGLVLLALTACAGKDAFLRGEEQLSSHDWEGAISSFGQASRENPGNLQFRSAALRATEQAVNNLLSEALAIREGQPNEASALYLRALRLSPSNERAAKGLEYIDAAKRQQRLFEEASRAASNGRDQEARAKYKKLLDEVPSHVKARKALFDIDEKNGRGNSQLALDPGLRKQVTLEFRDATLKSIFDALSGSTGINFVFDRDLKQDVRFSVFLRNVAFDEALEQLTSSNGLARRIVNSNTLLIYSAQPNKTKEYQNLVVRNFFVANADVKQLTNMLKTVIKVKDIYTDEKRNIIVVRDTPDIVAMAEKLVAAHDQPEPEVMLEVEILEFNHTRDDALGIKFPDQVSFGVASPITLDALQNINNTGINVAGLNPAVAINLRRQLGDINLLANPRIRVRNHEKAKFHIGDKVPVITSTTYPGTTTGASSSSVSYLDVGIKLEFEPTIQLDDDVIIKTVLEVSSITNKVENAGTTAYQLGTRNATTTLTLRDGETQVLAGLLSTDETNTTNRLPGLGDIPGLGLLFSNSATKGGRKEILLSITPRIVHNLHRPTDDLIEMNFGPETGSQSSGGAGPSAPAQQLVRPPQGTANTTSPSPSAPAPTALVPMVPFGGSTAPSGPSAPAPVPLSPTPVSGGMGGSGETSAPIDFDLPPGVGSTR